MAATEMARKSFTTELSPYKSIWILQELSAARQTGAAGGYGELHRPHYFFTTEDSGEHSVY